MKRLLFIAICCVVAFALLIKHNNNVSYNKCMLKNAKYTASEKRDCQKIYALDN